MLASARLTPRPPEWHPPWSRLIGEWLVAQSDGQRFASVSRFFEHQCGPECCEKLAGPTLASAILNGRATTLAKDLATIIASYENLRKLFARLIRKVRICCFAPGVSYELLGDVLRVYQTQSE